MRNFGISSRPALGGDGGGVNTQAGSRGANAIQAPNVIRFPSGRSFLPDSRASERELFISDETSLACALAVVVSCFVTALSALLYAGYNLYFLFDFG